MHNKELDNTKTFVKVFKKWSWTYDKNQNIYYLLH